MFPICAIILLEWSKERNNSCEAYMIIDSSVEVHMLNAQPKVCLGSQQEEKSIHFVCFPWWCVICAVQWSLGKIREMMIFRKPYKYHKCTPKLLPSANTEVLIQRRIKLAARKYINSAIPDTETFWASVTELAFTGSVYFYDVTGYFKESNSLVSVPLKYICICISCTAF